MATSYRHIIWDWNGTLLDDAWLSVAIINELLEKRGLPGVTAERYQEEFGFPVKDYYRLLGFDFAVEPFEELAAEFTVEYDRRRFDCRLRPHAREVLATLEAHGFIHSVLSAYEQSRLDEMVAFTGLRNHFRHLAGLSDYYAASKTDNGLRLLEELDCLPADLLLVGDTLHDVETAQAMGIDCALIPSGHQSISRLSTSGCPVLPTLQELLVYVGN